MFNPANSKNVLNYRDWNDSIGRYCFSPKNQNKHIRFAIDPLVIQRAAAEGPCQHHFATPEIAAEDFRIAVSRHIDKFGWDLGCVVRGEIPLGLAKLGLQVLAVFGIAADEECGSSYWAALWGLLGREIDKRGIKPEDLDLTMHQDNWSALTNWTNELNNGNLGKLPNYENYTGGRRHVRLPLNHGLLRMEDIQGLYRFFSRINLLPGSEIDPEDLFNDLRYYANDSSVFRGAHARRVLQDERLYLAAEQIANAAAQWDGKKVDLAKSSKPLIRMCFSIRGLEGPRIRVGLVELDSKGARKNLPGIELGKLFGTGSVLQIKVPVAYRPISKRLVLGVRSHLDGRFLESRYLRPGDDGLIALPNSGGSRLFEQKLQSIARGEHVCVHRGEGEGVPDGWVLYRLRLREGIQEPDIPIALKGFVRIDGPRVRLSGGLRIRGAWMEGAGPTISVRGGDTAVFIVDGAEYLVSDLCLHPERCPKLNDSGVHEVWIPGHHKDRVRFRVVKPKLPIFSSEVVEGGWFWRSPPQWPGRLQPLSNNLKGQMHGPVIEGEWPPVCVVTSSMTIERSAVSLASAIIKPELFGHLNAFASLKVANENHPNLLLRQLARAFSPRSLNLKR